MREIQAIEDLLDHGGLADLASAGDDQQEPARFAQPGGEHGRLLPRESRGAHDTE